MLRFFLFFLALLCLSLGALTVVRAPDWSAWKLALLAGEYGHWLAVIPLLVAGLAWWVGGESTKLTLATWGISALAIGLLLKPCAQAWQLARHLPEQLERQFGRVAVEAAPFSVRELMGRQPQPVPYSTHRFSGELALDLYRAVGRERAPCVIVVHGGGWDSGDRTQIPHFNHWLARRGYAVAAISYRLAPEFIWPAQGEDLLAAIRFLKANAATLGFDPNRLVLLGRSAGGQIVEAVGYANPSLGLRGLIGLYAPSDLIFGYENAWEDDMLRSPALMRRFLGGTPTTARDNYHRASGYFYVTKAAPPTLLLHGALDPLVWHRHSERLTARLTEENIPHTFVSLPWATHAFDFNLRGPGGQLTTYALEWFLGAVTADPPSAAIPR